MRSASQRIGPGLARTDRGRRGPFGSLLARAGEDVSTAEGLALAYADLPPAQRRQLLHCILRDARVAKADLLEPLVAMLSIEDDLDLAKELARAIDDELGEELRRLADLSPRMDADGLGWALMGKQGEHSTAVLTRHPEGEEPACAEVLCVRWTEERIEGIELASLEDAQTARLRFGEHLRSAPLSLTVDTVAPLLWRHRRKGGVFPHGAERFAELF